MTQQPSDPDELVNAQIRFPQNLSDLSRTSPLNSAQSRRRYIETLLQVSGDDARNIMVIVTVAIGFVTLLLKDIPPDEVRALPTGIRITMIVGLGLLFSSAGILFSYVAAIHQTRMSIARCIASNSALAARQFWAGPQGIKPRHGKKLMIARYLLATGVVAELIAIPFRYV